MWLIHKLEDIRREFSRKLCDQTKSIISGVFGKMVDRIFSKKTQGLKFENYSSP